MPELKAEGIRVNGLATGVAFGDIVHERRFRYRILLDFLDSLSVFLPGETRYQLFGASARGRLPYVGRTPPPLSS